MNGADPSGTFGLFGGCPAGSPCTSTDPGASNAAAANTGSNQRNKTGGLQRAVQVVATAVDKANNAIVDVEQKAADLVVGTATDPGFWASMAAVGPEFGAVGKAVEGAEEGADLATTAHGAERIAGSAATRGGVLSAGEVQSAQSSGRVLVQSDGATVHVLETSPGRFNVVVSGDRGIITTFKGLSDSSLTRLSNNYGWK